MNAELPEALRSDHETVRFPKEPKSKPEEFSIEEPEFHSETSRAHLSNKPSRSKLNEEGASYIKKGSRKGSERQRSEEGVGSDSSTSTRAKNLQSLFDKWEEAEGHRYEDIQAETTQKTETALGKASQALAEAQNNCAQISELVTQVDKLSDNCFIDEEMDAEPEEEEEADVGEGVQEEVKEENEAQAERFRRAQVIQDIITQVNFEKVLTLFEKVRHLNSLIEYQEEIKVSGIVRSNS